MPITEAEWRSISAMCEQIAKETSGHRASYFITGKVIKRDPDKLLVWMKEFGDQPVPVVGFDYTVKYYDTDQRGVLLPKTATVKVQAPQVGETVVVIREMGSRRLPRCVGVLKGKDWLVSESE